MNWTIIMKYTHDCEKSSLDRRVEMAGSPSASYQEPIMNHKDRFFF